MGVGRGGEAARGWTRKGGRRGRAGTTPDVTAGAEATRGSQIGRLDLREGAAQTTEDPSSLMTDASRAEWLLVRTRASPAWRGGQRAGRLTKAWRRLQTIDASSQLTLQMRPVNHATGIGEFKTHSNLGTLPRHRARWRLQAAASGTNRG